MMFAIIPVVVNILCALFIVRTMFVSRFFSQVLRKVSGAADADIDSGNFNWEWRYQEYSKVDFYVPIFKFWKPLKIKSFWKDEMFVTKGVVVSTILPKILADQEKEEAQSHEDW